MSLEWELWELRQKAKDLFSRLGALEDRAADYAELQELRAEVEKLARRVKAIEERIAALEELVDRVIKDLEAGVGADAS
jgi:seryl-tRNA synthetase